MQHFPNLLGHGIVFSESVSGAWHTTGHKQGKAEIILQIKNQGPNNVSDSLEEVELVRFQDVYLLDHCSFPWQKGDIMPQKT